MTDIDVQTRNNEAYELGEHRITFTHTQVEDEWEEEGVGSILVRDALDLVA